MIHTKFAAAEYQDEEKGGSSRQQKNLQMPAGTVCCKPNHPEITQNRKPLPIWELNEGDRILYVKLGEIDNAPDTKFTINPYRMATNMHLN